MSRSGVPNVVTIGIGGCSASGKTTLSLLLKEIFPNNTIHIIHQDAYFLPAERRLGIDSDCWEVIDGAAFVEDLQRMKAYGQPVEGEDVEGKILDHAIFPENMATIEKYKSFIVSMRAKIQSQMKPAAAFLRNPSVKALGVYADNSEDESESEAQHKPVICLVDGFLLYSNPTGYRLSRRYSKPWGPRSSSLTHRAPSDPMSRFADLHSINEDDDDKYAPTDEITPIAPPGPRSMSLQEQRVEAMRNLDIKLFLPTSKAAAKERRFRRTAYMDPPHGRRRPGQIWATERYFESIAWPNYEKENAFLFDGGNVNKPPESATFRWRDREMGLQKIMLAPKIDQPIEANVMWAVDVIIAEMKRLGIELAPDGGRYLVDKIDYKDRPADWIIDYAEEVVVVKSPKTLLRRIKQKMAWKARMSKGKKKTEARIKYETDKKKFLKSLKE